MEENYIQKIKSVPAKNGLAERFVWTMKQALKTSNGTQSLNRRLNAFLMSYRNTPHATTKVSPALSMLKRQLRIPLDLLRSPKTKEVVQRQQKIQRKRQAKVRFRTFTTGDKVHVVVLSGHLHLFLQRLDVFLIRWKPVITGTLSGEDMWTSCFTRLGHLTMNLENSPLFPIYSFSWSNSSVQKSHRAHPQELTTFQVDLSLLWCWHHVTPGPEFPQSSPRYPTTDSATSHIYPQRNRQPLDRLSL